MDTLVVDHYYALGIAWDRTRHRNHGVMYQSPPGTGQFTASLSFAPGRTAPGSAVAIPPSDSLANLGAIRVRAEMFLDQAALGRRNNIVEGHLAFALFVEPKCELSGTFLDAAGNWVGLRTEAYTVPLNRWCVLEFWYDGISMAELLVDGQRKASTYTGGPGHLTGSMRGPVRGVGNHGVFIGHWPEADDRYTLNGYVRRAQLYKRDDRTSLNTLLDPCCLGDMRQWIDLAERVKKEGMDGDALNAWLARMMAVGATMIDGMRGADEQRAADFDHVMRQFTYALTHRRTVALGPSLRILMDWMEENGKDALNEDTINAATKVLADFPLDTDEILAFGNDLCFSKVRDVVEREVTRRTGDKPPRRETADKRPKVSPDRDREDDDRPDREKRPKPKKPKPKPKRPDR